MIRTGRESQRTQSRAEGERTTAEEKELEIQLRMKELETSKTATAVVAPLTSPAGTRTEPVFDMSKHVKFVLSFSETEVNGYFLHFKKVAQSLKWTEDACTLHLQSGLVGKVRAVYLSLSVEKIPNMMLSNCAF